MPNITLSLPDDIYSIMKEHGEIKWSEVARRAISEYAKKLALLDALTKIANSLKKILWNWTRRLKKVSIIITKGRTQHEAGH